MSKYRVLCALSSAHFHHWRAIYLNFRKKEIDWASPNYKISIQSIALAIWRLNVNLDSDRYTILMLLLLLCMTPVLSLAVEKDTGTAVLVGRAISLTDVDSFKPIEYSRQSDDVIIGLRYSASTPVKIQIFGDGTVRGERIHSTSVRADSGVYAQVKVKHTFTAQLSEEHMYGMLKSTASLFNFDLAKVKKELSESVNCWDYCPM